MKNWISANIVLLAVAASSLILGRAQGAESSATQPATQPGPEPVKITLHPSPATQPAFQCDLLPSPLDQSPGDAAPLYMTANAILPTASTDEALTELWERVDNPPDLSPEQLAHDEKTELILKKCDMALKYVDLAARREDVHWNAGLREFGFDARLPYLNQLRHFQNIMSLQVRYQLARGDLPGAMRTMQTSLSITRQLNRRPLLIEGLVVGGLAESTMDHGVEAWIALPNSPNLYWALSRLPQPYINYQAIAQTERAYIYFQFPELREAAAGRELSPEQWRHIMLELIREDEYESAQQPPPDRAARLDRILASALPQAREYLISTGVPREQIQAMRLEQAVGRYFFHEYQIASDETWKAWELPYFQSIVPLREADERFEEWRATQNPFLVLMIKKISHPKKIFTRLDRHIAMLRTLEALRDYLAGHDGQLPERLDQMTGLPIPRDPFTGKAFLYHSNGRTAVLEGSPPENTSGWWDQRFEISAAVR